MNRLAISFFITLLLYILLFAILKFDLQKPKKLPMKKRFSLQNLKLIPIPKPTKKLATKPQPPKPKPKPKSIKKQEVAKKIKPKKTEKKKYNKKIKKTPKKRQSTAKKALKKSEQNSTKLPTTLPSLNTLFAKKSVPKKEPLPKEIQKLYKDEFSTFTKEQQKFIKDNLSKIGEITQKYLYLRGYPYIAVKTRQEGVNIVEFNLHPNGDITDLKLISSSGYEVLDKNSIETIKAAYKDYPLPKETTKIKIYVQYSIIY